MIINDIDWNYIFIYGGICTYMIGIIFLLFKNYYKDEPVITNKPNILKEHAEYISNLLKTRNPLTINGITDDLYIFPSFIDKKMDIIKLPICTLSRQYFAKRLKIVYDIFIFLKFMGQFISDCASKREDCCFDSTDQELFGRRYKGENIDQKFLTYDNIVKGSDLYVKKRNQRRKRIKRK